MIAWTSPLPTVRSIPWRISCSGSATGATRRPRMTRCWSVVGVGHGSVKAPWRMGSDGVGRRTLAGTRSARVIESSAPAIASRTRTHRTLTVQRALRSQVDARARDRRSRRSSGRSGPRGRGGPRSSRSRSGGAGELVAAVRAAGRDDEAGLAEAHDELLEVGPRQVLLGGDLGERGRARSRSGGRAGPSAGRRTRPSCEKETAPEPW